MQRNYIPVASAKQVDIDTTNTYTSFSKCILYQMNHVHNQGWQIKPTASTVHKFQLPANILSSAHTSLGYWGLHCPLISANLFEITTEVVCIQCDFVACYSSVMIQQQFLTSRKQTYIEICVILNIRHICVRSKNIF
jgi:hypothetical protein